MVVVVVQAALTTATWEQHVMEAVEKEAHRQAREQGEEAALMEGREAARGCEDRGLARDEARLRLLEHRHATMLMVRPAGSTEGGRVGSKREKEIGGTGQAGWWDSADLPLCLLLMLMLLLPCTGCVLVATCLLLVGRRWLRGRCCWRCRGCVRGWPASSRPWWGRWPWPCSSEPSPSGGGPPCACPCHPHTR